LSPKAQDWATIEAATSYAFDLGEFLHFTVVPALKKAKQKQTASRLELTYAALFSLLRTRREVIAETVLPSENKKAFLASFNNDVYNCVIRGAPIAGGKLADARREFDALFNKGVLAAAAKSAATAAVTAAVAGDGGLEEKKKKKRGGVAAKQKAEAARQAAARRARKAGKAGADSE
jgi:hypothetical protein